MTYPRSRALLPGLVTLSKQILALAACLVVLSTGLHAQVTGTPSYSAPRPAFHTSEFGAVMSFPEPGGTAVEGTYRASAGASDWGVRLGMLDPGGILPRSVLAGFDVRASVLKHTTDWPLDGAIILGAGGSFASGRSRITVPVGLSLGRRITFENSSVTVTPYAEPATYIQAGDRIPTDFLFGLGLGADVHLGGNFGVRMGVGLGDLQGVSLGAVWVH